MFIYNHIYVYDISVYKPTNYMNYYNYCNASRIIFLRLPQTACFRGEKVVPQLWDLTI